MNTPTAYLKIQNSEASFVLRGGDKYLQISPELVAEQVTVNFLAKHQTLFAFLHWNERKTQN